MSAFSFRFEVKANRKEQQLLSTVLRLSHQKSTFCFVFLSFLLSSSPSSSPSPWAWNIWKVNYYRSTFFLCLSKCEKTHHSCSFFVHWQTMGTACSWQKFYIHYARPLSLSALMDSSRNRNGSSSRKRQPLSAAKNVCLFCSPCSSSLAGVALAALHLTVAWTHLHLASFITIAPSSSICHLWLMGRGRIY